MFLSKLGYVFTLMQISKKGVTTDNKLLLNAVTLWFNYYNIQRTLSLKVIEIM